MGPDAPKEKLGERVLPTSSTTNESMRLLGTRFGVLDVVDVKTSNSAILLYGDFLNLGLGIESNVHATDSREYHPHNIHIAQDELKEAGLYIESRSWKNCGTRDNAERAGRSLLFPVWRRIVHRSLVTVGEMVLNGESASRAAAAVIVKPGGGASFSS
ncbi:hypothetical protein ACO22_05502 [Paracoccidioides brasiliensis]|uniref:Uncharacterized protein n=1 Tax=Paracoccidioides brasiliensis TaxID=121759 RepID=A0A1D2JA42_PARBR|nr:hypothetical protein ACO22_05502 [Paracoccidioides brasiliensis]